MCQTKTKLIECDNCIHLGTDYDLEEFAGAIVEKPYSICKIGMGQFLGNTWLDNDEDNDERCPEYED